MVCIHCLSIFGFIMAILYEIMRKSYGFSFGSLFGKNSEGTTDSKDQTPPPGTSPYVAKKSLDHKPKRD
jgi:hypothetical protein